MTVEPTANSLNNNEAVDRSAAAPPAGGQGDALVNQFNQALSGGSAAATQQPTAAESALKVSRGQLTFDAEGNDDPDSAYFSRKLHVPNDNSGVTLGRGYDMKEKSAEKIKNDLIEAGIDAATAKKLSKASGKSGDAARDLIKQEGLEDLTITREQQKSLFEKTYDDLAADVHRICGKADTEKEYGKVDWDNLDPKIKDMLVDLRFRGDYTSSSRRVVQKHVADNDLQAFTDALKDKDNWLGVPKDRFERRVDYLDAEPAR